MYREKTRNPFTLSNLDDGGSPTLFSYLTYSIVPYSDMDVHPSLQKYLEIYGK